MIPHEQLELSAQSYRDRTAVVCGPDSVTYGELRDRARSLAAWLVAQGIGRGDVGLTLLENSVEFAISFFACSYLGALFMPIDPRLAPTEVTRLCAIAEPTFLIGSRESAESSGLLFDGSIQWRAIVTTREDEQVAGEPPQLRFGDLETLPPDSGFTPADLDAEDPMALLATSGTTGRPKLATLSARAWDLFTYGLETCWQLGPGDGQLVPVPMSHVVGPICLNACVSIPITLVAMKRYSPRRMLEVIREHTPSFCCITPSMARVLLDGLSRDELHDIGRITKVAVFGAPMPPSHLDEFKEKVGVPPHTGYGLTEATPLVCITPADTGIHRVGSLGKPVPMPGMSVRVVDRDGADVPTGEVGEIIIGGTCLMLGYYRDKAATDDTLRDGWLYTGDLGKFDEEGYLYIVGRKKDIIVVHGFNVLPGEVESVLACHPGVKQVAVIGETHPRSGECVVAYVVGELDSEVTESELIEQARGALAEYKVPREIRFVPDLPKTSVGKISRGTLREQAQQR